MKGTFWALLLTIAAANAEAVPYYGLGFQAPQVSDESDVKNPSQGDIIFDWSSSTTGTFKGYNGGTWQTLGAPTYTAPTVQKFSSGSAATYTTPANVLYIRVRMVGGGGGGAGSGTGLSSTNSGSDGNASYWKSGDGSTTYGTANGGAGGSYTTNAGPGGTASTSGVTEVAALSGAHGAPGMYSASSGAYLTGGIGGGSYFGGSGTSASANAGGAGKTNSGSGGGGGGNQGVSSAYSGAGGGAGGYAEFFISNPASTYQYTVGASSNGGSAGTSGYAGGNGAAGLIIVEEYYQ